MPRTPPSRRRSTSAGGRVAAAALSLVCSLGCAEFDQPSKLEDLRVLGMRTEPAEILYSAFYVFLAPEDRPPFLALPEYDVTVDVYAYDPRPDAELESTFQLCPIGRGACFDYDPEAGIIRRFQDGVDPEGEEEVRAVYGIQEREQDRADLFDDPSGRMRNMRYSFTFTDSVMDSILRDSRGNPTVSPFPILPQFVVEVQNARAEEVTWERAFKRIPLSLDLADPNIPEDTRAFILDLLGLEVCTEGIFDALGRGDFVEERSTCFYPRVANENPVLVGFDIVDTDAEDALIAEAETDEEIDEIRPPIKLAERADLYPRALLRIDPGAQLTLRPVFAPGTVEPYQIYSFDLDNQNLILENRFEDIVVSWVSTHGDVPELTQTQFGEVLDATFLAPARAELNTIRAERGLEADSIVRDSIVVVVRDQRGGVAYGQIDVEYRDGANE